MPFLIGLYIGALIITGAMTWVFFRVFKKFSDDMKAALLAFIITLIGSNYLYFLGSDGKIAILVYAPTSFFWLIFNIIRIKKKNKSKE